jgi:hypothetical protein
MKKIAQFSLRKQKQLEKFCENVESGKQLFSRAQTNKVKPSFSSCFLKTLAVDG